MTQQQTKSWHCDVTLSSEVRSKTSNNEKQDQTIHWHWARECNTIVIFFSDRATTHHKRITFYWFLLFKKLSFKIDFVFILNHFQCAKEIPNTGRIEMVALALLRHHAIVAAPIWGCDIILHRISGDTHPTDDALGAPFRSLTPFLVCPLGGKFAPREGNLPPGRKSKLIWFHPLISPPQSIWNFQFKFWKLVNISSYFICISIYFFLPY